ncbi:glycosyltransferase, partial [Halorubrum sp. SD612]|uniref:glycosyltransferase family 2 protein n=1 Tax=Halorubrum sp. SD612 TaxID=1855863 RepID=UPI000A2D10E2
MDLSVVVPTLNGRDRLAACLDALAADAPDAEVIVVNGPSADGTTGMVRDRDDVDVLVEISDRTVNVARNAGIEVATGDAVALVDYDNRIEPGWRDAVADGLDAAPVVSGPVTPIPRGEPTDR